MSLGCGLIVPNNCHQPANDGHGGRLVAGWAIKPRGFFVDHFPGICRRDRPPSPRGWRKTGGGSRPWGRYIRHIHFAINLTLQNPSGKRETNASSISRIKYILVFTIRLRFIYYLDIYIYIIYLYIKANSNDFPSLGCSGWAACGWWVGVRKNRPVPF